MVKIQDNYWLLLIRFIVHWATIPFKLVYNLLGSSIQLVKNLKDAPLTGKYNPPNLSQVLNNFPIWKTNIFSSYVSGQPHHLEIDGKHHITSDQCQKHGLYMFILHQTEEGRQRKNETLEKGLRMFIHPPYLVNGYKYNQHALFEYDAKTVSTETLSYLNLGILVSDNNPTLETYERLVDKIVENDYSLIEGQQPTNILGKTEWDKQLKFYQNRTEKIKVKSLNCILSPSLRISGVESLSLLATLKLDYLKNKDISSLKEYNKVFWKYGYWLLSLLPITNNKKFDKNLPIVVNSLYVLLKTNCSFFEKLIFKTAIKYVWKLAKHKNDAFVAGMIFDVCPELITPKNIKYLQQCLNNRPTDLYGYSGYIMALKAVHNATNSDKSKTL